MAAPLSGDLPDELWIGIFDHLLSACIPRPKGHSLAPLLRVSARWKARILLFIHTLELLFTRCA
jgi:hypothetical protein